MDKKRRGQYLVGEFGTVISIRRRGIRKTLAQTKNSGGYLYVSLSTPDYKGKRSVHSLVAETFIGPNPAKMQVNHVDGDKLNNCASNLEYVTPAQNIRHFHVLRKASA